MVGQAGQAGQAKEGGDQQVRVMRPGCKVDTALVLEGRQGIGKSSSIRALAPWPSVVWDSPLDLNNKDGQIALQGHWFIELSELDALGRAAVSRIKSFLSLQEALGRVRQYEHLVTEDQLRLILTPGGITLNRSIVKALCDRETRHHQEPTSFADLSLQGGGLALAGRSLFSLQRQGTWINCFAHEGINLDGLLVDFASHLANANAVETTVKGSVLRRLVAGYDALVEDASLIDLGPEADLWLGMAAFKPRSENW